MNKPTPTRDEMILEQMRETEQWVKATYDCTNCPDVDLCYDGEICLYYDNCHKKRSPQKTEMTRDRIMKLRAKGILTYDQLMKHRDKE